MAAVAVLHLAMLLATAPYTLSVISAMPLPVVVAPGGTQAAEADQMIRTIRATAVASILVEMSIAVGLMVLTVLGAFKRWVWVYWLALVFNGFSVLGLALTVAFGLLALAGGGTPHPPGAVRVRVSPEPTALQVSGWLLTVVTSSTFVAMLAALIRIGPWACRNELAEDAAGPPGARYRETLPGPRSSHR